MLKSMWVIMKMQKLHKLFVCPVFGEFYVTDNGIKHMNLHTFQYKKQWCEFMFGYLVTLVPYLHGGMKPPSIYSDNLFSFCQILILNLSFKF